MQTVGILGGLGPLAGAHFYRRLVELTPADRDEAHIPIILISNPAVPSRIAHLSGAGESPVPKLMEICHQLVQAGAEVIALPSSTTSIYQTELAQGCKVPIISLINEVTGAISRQGCRRIGIMGTTPTRTFAVYDGAFAERGIESVYPDDQSQSDIMNVIQTVKGANQTHSEEAGTSPGDATHLESLSNEIAAIASRPWASNLDAVLLGCTELPVLFPDSHSKQKFPAKLHVFSSTDILAAVVVRMACGDLAMDALDG